MLNDQQKHQLLEIARKSIEYGLETGQPLPVELTEFDETLRRQRATFVTLHKNKELRGCIGMLEPRRPLVEDVAHNAFSAAFSDPRFFPVRNSEVSQLDIHISILGTPEKVEFNSEDDLVAMLRPGIDGLILTEHGRRGTFLPSVWESLPDKQDFLNHLKVKSGLPADYWSDDIEIQRYTVEEF